ncbi:Jumping translocation breakpoint protein (JTB) [Popillia japonica]|uniref:Protein JTB n=1 Tax=Popillia japonica TaxID=7064 RepID=A0AAW1IB17_POPJA
MIETCPKKRMFLGITGLGVLTILVLIVESHLTDRISSKKRDFPVEQNSTCKDKDTFEIIKHCEPCSAYDIASQSIGVCIHTHFKEVIKCSSGEMVTRSCDRAAYLDEKAYWKFEGFMFVSIFKETLSEPLFNCNLSQIHVKYYEASNLSSISEFCVWPVVITGIDVTAGLCSVARKIIKCCRNEKYKSLLGFKDACLLACSESSIWTKFCEIDMPKTVKDTLTKVDDYVKNGNLHIPLPLIKFEYHMQQPVRMHNIYKVARESHSDKTLKSSVSIENLNLVHTYGEDPHRYKSHNRLCTKQLDIENSFNIINNSSIKIFNSFLPFGNEIEFDWSTVPLDANPEGGALPKKRASRKCEQLENLAKAVIKIAEKEKYLIVDFCSGSGHLGILLATLLPNCQVILVENKERSLQRARERIGKLNLKNIFMAQCNLNYFKAKFHIGTSLHACGVATDLVIQNCINNGAHFVACPCCYGGIRDCNRIKYPRSAELSALNISIKEYLIIAHAADQTHDEENIKTKQGFFCMDIIDNDRKLMAESQGYIVHLGKLQPPSCTPKNNLLVGLSKHLDR